MGDARTANNSMKLCPPSTSVLRKRKRASGGRYIRSAAFIELIPSIFSSLTQLLLSLSPFLDQSLQLLEYLVKNGSERVVDDARSHVSMIKILRNFHYIDEKGKDQGINVRNRSRELATLLGDLDQIRQERRKAKQLRNKYLGSAGGGGSATGGPSFSSGGSRYGGFGSDQYISQYGKYMAFLLAMIFVR
jgi:epsin